MADIVVRVDGLEFHAASVEDEPRVRDLDVAERLGYERPRKVRELIKRLVGAGILKESDYRPIVGRAQTGVGTSRDVTEYMLTESGALKVAARSDTPQAVAMLDTVIRWYVEAKRQVCDLAVTSAAPPLDGEALRQFRDGVQRVEDFPEVRRRLADKIGYVAYRTKRHRSAVAGVVRRLCRVASEYAITLDRLPFVLDQLDALGDMKLLLPARKRQPKRETGRGQLLLFPQRSRSTPA